MVSLFIRGIDMQEVLLISLVMQHLLLFFYRQPFHY